jgi:2-keto-4-pentenoate hydratase/2-oxohepta-3-ene-1,7-dioic acid hydratase in catechol pathway
MGDSIRWPSGDEQDLPMRWLRFEIGGRTRVGYLRGTDPASDVQPVVAESLQDVIAGRGTGDAGAPVPRAGLRLLAPLVPGKILCIGLNYMDHCREQHIAPPERPTLFAKFPSSVIGPGEPIRWPADFSDQVDYEAELAVVIGRPARRVAEADALAHVFGYTAANDVTARDVQRGDKQWIRGKAADTFCPLGPVVVSADEIPDPQQLPIGCRVNGEPRQASHTREMIFPVAHIVSFISRAITLDPGDVILTGTPDGVGVYRDPKVFLQPGDRVEIEVGGFGVLDNPVGAHVA